MTSMALSENRLPPNLRCFSILLRKVAINDIYIYNHIHIYIYPISRHRATSLIEFPPLFPVDHVTRDFPLASMNPIIMIAGGPQRPQLQITSRSIH